MKKHKYIYQNNKGQALVYAMTFLAVATVTLLAIMRQSSHTKNIIIQKSADEDVQVAAASILSFFNNGGNCNANFETTAGNLPASNTVGINHIEICTTGSCKQVDGGRAPYFTAPTASWDPAVTKLSNRIRFSKYKYRVIDPVPLPVPQYPAQKCFRKVPPFDPMTPCNPANPLQHGIPATLEMTLYFEKRISSASTNTSGLNSFREVSTKIYFPIVANSPDTTAPDKIKGCPIDANSTVIYHL